jgi:hypothetical protein
MSAVPVGPCVDVERVMAVPAYGQQHNLVAYPFRRRRRLGYLRVDPGQGGERLLELSLKC